MPFIVAIPPRGKRKEVNIVMQYTHLSLERRRLERKICRLSRQLRRRQSAGNSREAAKIAAKIKKSEDYLSSVVDRLYSSSGMEVN